MRRILLSLLLGIILALAHGEDSRKAHLKKSKKSSPSIKKKSPTRAKRSSTPRSPQEKPIRCRQPSKRPSKKRRPPPPSKKRKRPPPPRRRRPPPPSNRRKRPPPPRRRRPPPPSNRRRRPPPPRRRPPPPRVPKSPPPPPLVVEPSFYSYEIIQELLHNASSFTQGLEYEAICTEPSTGGTAKCNEIFWESTGLYGQSSVKQVELSTGKTIRMRDLPDSDFGEGLTKINDVLYQLTWKSGKIWAYDPDNFSNYTIVQVRNTLLLCI